MRWGDARRSDNVEDRRGGIGVGHIGIGGIVIALLLSWATGTNPLQMLGLVSQVEQGVSPPAASAPANPNDPGVDDPAAGVLVTVASVPTPYSDFSTVP